jgi:predicted glutamine amidotransferase
MCELLAVSASAPVDVKVSLTTLARHGGETDQHRDGWGVAFLDGRDARIIREPGPAAASPWIGCIARHGTPCDTVIAHIRRATQGAISLANTQPFAREMRGRMHVYAHNGMVEDLPAMAGGNSQVARFQPIGETDSEIAFCRFLTYLAELPDETEVAFAAFVEHARTLAKTGPANILYASAAQVWAYADRRHQADGTITPPGLWLLERTCAALSDNVYRASGVDIAGPALRVILLASVPLTSESWKPLARGTALWVADGEVRRMNAV